MGTRRPQAPPLQAFVLAVAVLSRCLAAEQHAEELLLQPLDDSAVLAHFEFRSAVELHAAHTRGFPPALLDLARRHGVAQLELSLTQGRWAWRRRRTPAAAAAPPKPSGLELKVAFLRGVGDTQAAYAALAHGLGGLLCAGVATVPQLAVMAAPAAGWFCGDGGSPWLAAAAAAAGNGSEAAAAGAAAAEAGGAGGRQVYAWLGQEGVCTENLAAWRRLLPCGAAAGLGALPQPTALAAAPYHSLGLHLWVQPRGDGGVAAAQQHATVQLRQVLTVVLPAGAAAGQQQQGVVEAVFGTGLPPACAAAASSRLYVAVGSMPISNPPSGCQQQATAAGPLLACDLQQAAPPQLPASLLSVAAEAAPAWLQVVQHLVQQGSQAGTLVTSVRVAAAAAAAAAQGQAGSGGGGGALLHIMQLLPWQLMVQERSVQVALGGGEALGPHSPQLVWQAVDARPDRTAVVEALVRLPPPQQASSSAAWHEVTLSLAYRAAFVGVFDHAPDASRGVDVPPALATLLPAACDGGDGGGGSAGDEAGGTHAAPPLLRRLQLDCGAAQAYSGGGGGGLVPLPLPDLSMPFNVICFTSTLLAVLLGGAANAVLRTPAELAGTALAAGGAPRWRRKLRRLAALAVGMAALAVYLDKDLQRRFDAAAHRFGLGRTRAPELHGEL